jgi:hypothetical protein
VKNKKYHAIRIVSKSNKENHRKGKIYTFNTHIHDHSLSWLGTGTSRKSDGVKLIL